MMTKYDPLHVHDISKREEEGKENNAENTGLIISENSLSEVNIKLMYKTDKPIFFPPSQNFHYYDFRQPSEILC